MTEPHHGPAVGAADMDAAETAMRAGGLRVSAARRLVLEALFAADRPVTAEQIANGLDGTVPRSDVASTYRNLETLERVGLVRHFHAGHGPGLYVLAAREPQEYLVCESCGETTAVPSDTLDAARALIRDELGFDARFSHFPILGLCARCR